MSAAEVTGLRSFDADGVRVGVITCTRCGCALLIDPADAFDVVGVHLEWHDRVAIREGEAR